MTQTLFTISAFPRMNSICCLVVISTFSFYVWSTCTEGMWIGRTWIPAPHCTLMEYDRFDIARCFHDKNLVFAGNSVTRHLYHLFLNILNDIPDVETDAERLVEKAKETCISPTDVEKGSPLWSLIQEVYPGNIANNVTCNAQCSSKKDNYDSQYEYCLQYNSNHPVPLYKQWTLLTSSSSNIITNYQGHIYFLWTYDWYSPMLLHLLQKPNTIMTSNAGLNWYWAYNNHWEIQNPLEIVNKQFPILWNTPLFNTSSRMIYRQLTHLCHSFSSFQEKEHNHHHHIYSTDEFIMNYTINHPLPFHSILSLHEITFDRMHYLDCTHHPGPVSYMILLFLFNDVCNEEEGRRRRGGSGKIIDRNQLLNQYNNTIVYIVHENKKKQAKTKKKEKEKEAESRRSYYWLIHQSRVSITNENFMEYVKSIVFEASLNQQHPQQQRIFQASTSFLKYVPILSL